MNARTWQGSASDTAACGACVTLNRFAKLSMIDSLVSVGRAIMSLYPCPVVLAKYSSTSPSWPRLRVHPPPGFIRAVSTGVFERGGAALAAWVAALCAARCVQIRAAASVTQTRCAARRALAARGENCGQNCKTSDFWKRNKEHYPRNSCHGLRCMQFDGPTTFTFQSDPFRFEVFLRLQGELQLCGDDLVRLDALLDGLQRTRLHVLLAVRSCGRAGGNFGGNFAL